MLQNASHGVLILEDTVLSQPEIQAENGYQIIIWTYLNAKRVMNSLYSKVTLNFYKNSSIKLPKIQKKQVQIRMWSYDRNRHTHTQVMTPTSTPHVNR